MIVSGFFKRILTIDLTTQTTSVETLSDALLAQTLGGKGLGAHLLMARNPAGVDPLAPENHFILVAGPAADSPIWGSCRHGIFAKAPLTGAFGESYSGGKAAIPISRTGYDAIILKGAAAKPLWLEISDVTVRFHDAGELWGLDTYSTEDAIKGKLDKQATALVIGPAGEKLVRFAVVENDYWRSAGRAGMGAVLGSKNIKGLAFYGNQRRPAAFPDELKDFSKAIIGQFKTHKAAEGYRNFGTPMMVALLNTAGGFPTRYWSQGTLQGWEGISAESMRDRCGAKPKSCHTCFMGCGKLVKVAEGRHRGLQLEGPEYETIYSFGGLCGIDQIEEIVYLNDLCDRLGLDTMSAGNLIAFAIEASQTGHIKESLHYGDADAVADLLHKIARREGLGDLLAQGIKAAAAELGLEDLAVHVKGMEPAGYDPRVLKGMGLAYAVSDRGACHLRSTFYKAELSGQIDMDTTDNKAELFMQYEDRCTLMDSLIVCRFYRDIYWDHLPELVRLTTGLTISMEELHRIAGAITDTTRRFNLQEGFTHLDDRLPRRLHDLPLENGQAISPEQVQTMVSDYYRLRGWNAQGVPSGV